MLTVSRSFQTINGCVNDRFRVDKQNIDVYMNLWTFATGTNTVKYLSGDITRHDRSR